MSHPDIGRSRGRADQVVDAFAQELGERYVRVGRPQDQGYDFESTEGHHVIGLRQSLHGVRDVDAALLQLALVVAESPPIQRAILVATAGRISSGRVLREWDRVRKAVRPDVARRLAMVVLAPERIVSMPESDPEVEWLAGVAKRALVPSAPAMAVHASAAAWTPKSFDVWMVLLDAWLRGDAPIGAKEIAARSGCSYPTITAALGRMEGRGEITRTRDRRVTLTTLPRQSLSEVLVSSESLRSTLRFADTSGRRPDPEGLLRRISAKAPPDVALGGVVAARHYVSEFDLNGIPRIDISVRGQSSPSWLEGVDPALRPAQADRSPVLVVHHLRDRAPDRQPAKPARQGRLAVASPAETLMDLYDLRLTSQADEFVRAMRSNGVVRGRTVEAEHHLRADRGARPQRPQAQRPRRGQPGGRVPSP